MTEIELRQKVNYRRNDDLADSLSWQLAGKEKDERPSICLNCFYGGVFLTDCGVIKDEDGHSVNLKIDSLGVCDRYRAAPYRIN